jgi:hypothetical protein
MVFEGLNIAGRQTSTRVSLNQRDLKVTGFCGDGARFCGDRRAVVQPNAFPDTEQVLKATDSPGSQGCSLRGLSTVLCKLKEAAMGPIIWGEVIRNFV